MEVNSSRKAGRELIQGENFTNMLLAGYTLGIDDRRYLGLLLEAIENSSKGEKEDGRAKKAQQQRQPPSEDGEMCTVCYEVVDRMSALVPCGHSKFCLQCSCDLHAGRHEEGDRAPRCPICRREIAFVLPLL